MITETKTVQKKIYWYCPRCDVNTLNKGKDMLPCPRGSCEAVVHGQLVITKVIELALNKKGLNHK